MTGNDKEIDVLLTRFAKSVAMPAAGDHLDADELNSFAEGSLPAAARQQYVSHLADCDDCRKLASQLAVATGAATEARVPASQSAAGSWWQKLGLLLAPATLRYAAFAVVLLGVVGIALVVWRRPAQRIADRNADLIAQHQPEAESGKPSGLGPNSGSQDRGGALTSTVSPKATVAPDVGNQKSGDTTGASAPPPPPKPAEGYAENEKSGAALAAKAPESPRAEASPSYAPAPVTESYRVDNRAREQQNVGNVHGGPRRNETRNESYDKLKVLDNNRAGELAKSKDADEDRSLPAKQAPVRSENKADDAPSARAGTASSGSYSRSGRDAQERDAARKREAVQTTSEENPETRSVGGRKFKRQGNAWVDAKFKSSMSTRNIARGSEEFDKLDSGLRSIAQQLGGDIIVVWKGKAYRIK